MSEAVLSHHAIKINARARCGCTALIVGSFLRRHTILDRILARPDTDPTIRCVTHNTALLAAAHRLYFDTVNKIVESPLRSKLDFHETAGCGCNLFICAARSGDEETFLSFLSLTKWQDSPNTVDCKLGRTALLWASFYGQEPIVRLLLSNPSVDSNHRDKNGNNGLMLAVNSGREEVVRTFLTSPGVNINARNASGDTALSLAMWYGYERIVCLLLARKDVDVSLLDHRFGGQ
jgi:ankyrin repeat protein